MAEIQSSSRLDFFHLLSSCIQLEAEKKKKTEHCPYCSTPGEAETQCMVMSNGGLIYLSYKAASFGGKEQLTTDHNSVREEQVVMGRAILALWP